MAGKKSTTEKKVYTIGGEEVTDLKQITLPIIKRHVMELGKKDAKWLMDFMKTEVENSVTDIIGAMYHDKKRTGSGIKFIMLHSLGDSFINPVENDKVKELFGVN